MDYENNATFNTTTEGIQSKFLIAKIFGAWRGINRCTFTCMAEQLVLTTILITCHHRQRQLQTLWDNSYTPPHFSPLRSFLLTPFPVTPSGHRIFYGNDVARFSCVTTFRYCALQRRWMFTTRFAFVFFMPVSPTSTHSHHPFIEILNPNLLCAYSFRTKPSPSSSFSSSCSIRDEHYGLEGSVVVGYVRASGDGCGHSPSQEPLFREGSRLLWPLPCWLWDLCNHLHCW